MKQFFGYIEGYFGRELNWTERFGMVDHLAELGMNAYVLAPKEDPFHRVKWKTPYPREEMQKIADVVKYGKKKSISVLPALAPGLSYDYSGEDDYAVLLGKYKDFLNNGINQFGLFMDDIKPELPDNCKDKFHSLGEAHGTLLIRLSEDLRNIDPQTGFWFCPTIYTEEFVEGDGADSPYLIDLAANIPVDIPVFWTGEKFVAPEITVENIKRISQLFNGNIIIWDNYYANDYCTQRVYLGPYINRDPEIIGITKGIMQNPTGHYLTDKFLLKLFSDFLNGEKTDDASWEKAATEYGFDERFFKIKEFFWGPFYKTPKPSEEMIDHCMEFYHNFIVQWQNPLKLELFPYLYALFLDLQYLMKRKEGTLTRFWLFNVFPPIIAQELEKLSNLKD